MSKNKKKKNNKKSMSPETVEKLKTGFGTILSNDACIRAARGWHGGLDAIPIILGLVSVILAVLPTFVSRINVQGNAAIFSAPSSNYEQGFAEFLDTLVYDGTSERNLSLTIGEDGTFHLSEEDRKTLTGGTEAWYTLERTIETGKSQPVYEVFFNTSSVDDLEFFSRITAGKNPYTNEERSINGTAATTYVASYLAFGKDSIAFQRRNELQTFSGLRGLYDHLGGTDFTALAKGLRAKGLTPSQSAYVQESTTFLKDVLNRSYETYKIQGTWQYTGIFAGIDFGLVILFGLVLFLMTRGKKNPYRIFTFWETQKMSYWAAFTPALLSMVLGFIMTQYAFIFFMFAFGMRMMWMSMRSLRPTTE